MRPRPLRPPTANRWQVPTWRRVEIIIAIAYDILTLQVLSDKRFFHPSSFFALEQYALNGFFVKYASA
ncbi:MAG: hypothetical protein RIM23_29000 [Coleofasciculus sp. G3-WIS-01]|uniref:hypothetical protein n=1 Tax=Coleofasciculus sp. G3-WIS-01 TaxID=3069528 RepID=UPI0032FC1A98